MRTHPYKPFVVDAQQNVNTLDENSAPRADLSLMPTQSRSNSEDDEYVDLTNEPPTGIEQGGISPGAFSAVSGNQQIFYRRNGNRRPKRMQRTRGLRASVRYSDDPRTARVAGASVLRGASNFVISGATIAPGAFSAIAGNQEIWVD
jgi:hypothetical protein